MIRDHATDTTLNMQSLSHRQAADTESVFGTHLLRPSNPGPMLHRTEHPDWVFGILLTGFILIAWTLSLYYKRFHTLVSAGFSKRWLSQLTREGNPLRERLLISLSSVYLLTIALTIYQWNELHTGWSYGVLTGFRLYALILLLVVLFWTVKLFAMNFLSIVFRTHQSNYEYLLNLMIFSTLTGLVTLPLLVLSVYLHSPTVLYILLGCIGILFIIRFIKGLLIGAALTRFSYLFLFVYLCALEILPLAVLLKLMLAYNVL